MDCSPPGSSVHGISQGRILKPRCYLILKALPWWRDRWLYVPFSGEESETQSIEVTCWTSKLANTPSLLPWASMLLPLRGQPPCSLPPWLHLQRPLGASLANFTVPWITSFPGLPCGTKYHQNTRSLFQSCWVLSLWLGKQQLVPPHSCQDPSLIPEPV